MEEVRDLWEWRVLFGEQEGRFEWTLICDWKKTAGIVGVTDAVCEQGVIWELEERFGMKCLGSGRENLELNDLRMGSELWRMWIWNLKGESEWSDLGIEWDRFIGMSDFVERAGREIQRMLLREQEGIWMQKMIWMQKEKFEVDWFESRKGNFGVRWFRNRKGALEKLEWNEFLEQEKCLNDRRNVGIFDGSWFCWWIVEWVRIHKSNLTAQ